MVPIHTVVAQITLSGLPVRHHIGTAAELHAIAMPTGGDTGELWVMHPTGSALVLGSSQRAEQFEVERLLADGVEVSSRRSGGGAVFIDPAQTVWIDVLAPRSGDLWSSDLGQTFVAVGRRWQAAFAHLGVPTELCERPPARSSASSAACWAGLGWGELTIAGAKVVGLSQRRTRWGARVQAMAVIDTSTVRVAHYLAQELRDEVTNAIATTHASVLARASITTAMLEAAVLAQFA